MIWHDVPVIWHDVPVIWHDVPTILSRSLSLTIDRRSALKVWLEAKVPGVTMVSVLAINDSTDFVFLAWLLCCVIDHCMIKMIKNPGIFSVSGLLICLRNVMWPAQQLDQAISFFFSLQIWSPFFTNAQIEDFCMVKRHNHDEKSMKVK